MSCRTAHMTVQGTNVQLCLLFSIIILPNLITQQDSTLPASFTFNYNIIALSVSFSYNLSGR